MDENPKIEKYEFDGVGLSTAERHKAKKQFEEYRNKYHIENLSDLQLLAEKVFRETLQIRIKKKIGKLAKNKKLQEENIVPSHMMRTMNENLDKILLINDKLGLSVDKKEDNDAFKHLEILKKKFKIWLKENQGSRTLACPHCSQMIMLRIRTDAWEAQKHTMFRDKILCNDHLVKLFMQKKLTADDCAKVLGTSNDYIQWLIEKWYENEK